MKRHLVIQLARFGDLIQTKRLIRSLSGPDGEPSQTHLLVDVSLAETAALLYPDVILHTISSRGFPASASAAHLERHGSILTDALFSLRELVRLDFEAIYNLNYSGMNFALSSLFDPARLRGYRMSGGQALRDKWSSLSLRLVRDRRLSVLNLTDFWAGYADVMLPPGQVNPAASPRGGGIGVAVAGRHARRTLPPEVLAPVLAATLERIGHGPIVLLGGKTEKSSAAALSKLLKPRHLEQVRDLTGKTGWRDLFEVVSGLDVLLTPDTGTMHLAAHLGVPVEAFFLSSASGHETGPYGLGHRVWQAVRDCAPCAEAVPCPYNVACLAPFTDRALLRRLSGQAGPLPDGLPDGLALLQPDFDDLGVICRTLEGPDPWAAPRASLRALLREHKGLPPDPAVVPDPALYDAFFREADWMTA